MAYREKGCDTSHYEKELPKGWCITSLGEAFSLQAGKNISAVDIHEPSDMFPYPCYGGNGIRGYVNSYNRSGHYPLIGRQGALCGNINEVSGNFYATEHCVVVNTFSDVDVNWTIYLLKALNLNQYATATAQPGLSVTTINEVPFCLPPYKEQKRIATALSLYSKFIDCIDEEAISLSNAINTIKSKILDLAISGKLVPQDPADEPATGLLKRINPDFKPCDNSHYPYEIPNNWSLSTFGQLNNHQSKTINPLTEPEKTFELYSVPIFETGKPEILKGKEIGSTKQLVHKGDVLVCKINPHLNRVWVVEHYNIQMNCIASSEWMVFQHPALLPRYALLIFQSPYFREKLMSNVSGVGGSLMRARPSAVDGYFVPIPPINEQRRIVQAVDKILDNLSSIVNFL